MYACVLNWGLFSFIKCEMTQTIAFLYENRNPLAWACVLIGCSSSSFSLFLPFFTLFSSSLFCVCTLVFGCNCCRRRHHLRCYFIYQRAFAVVVVVVFFFSSPTPSFTIKALDETNYIKRMEWDGVRGGSIFLLFFFVVCSNQSIKGDTSGSG